MNTQQQQQYLSPDRATPDAFNSHPLPSTYHHAVDDFGRMQSTQTKPRGAGTLPQQLRSPRSATNNNLTKLTSPLVQTRSGPDFTPSMQTITRPAPPNVPQGEEAFPYGYTHEGWDIEVPQAVATQVVDICGQEIRARGLDSPLIFSSMALDLSAAGVSSLIRCLAECIESDLWQSRFVEEARYANVHNLAAMIKWTLARLGRFYSVPVPSQTPFKKGEVQEEVAIVHQRGWLELEPYLAWREQEKGEHRRDWSTFRPAGNADQRRFCTASDHPYTAFSHYCSSIDGEAAQLLRSLLSLLSSTTSYSLKNGMTPSRLARLFGVLLFGLPEDETFSRTYESYIRAANATEHLLLAHIRDLAAYEVLPIRLMNHVTGYPSMLSPDLLKLPTHIKTIPITQVERQVRLYSSDLIQTACELDLLTQSKEWAACCSSSEHHGKDPQLSDRFRKLINLRGGGRQGRRGRQSRDTLSPDPALRGHSGRSANKSEDPSSYSSVAQQDWGNFMFEGFTDTDQSKLNFDLRESERTARTKKRDTVGWNEFTNVGFADRDDSLTAVLNFDGGLKEDIDKWPDEKAELLAKLRETTVKLPPFPYDSNPKVVAHAADDERMVAASTGEGLINRMDEVFAEVWADYLIGNGWSNRDELTHRSANFVVLQYKSRPASFTVGSQDAGSSRATSAVVPSLTSSGDAIPADDRADASWFVVQEVVPGGYRADLEAAGKVKSRSRPSMRKINVFRKLKRDKTVNTASSSASAVPEKDDSDKFFPPGTKKLQLSRETGTLPDASLDLDRNGSVSTKRGAMSTLFSSPLLPSSEPDTVAAGSPSAPGESGRGLMSALRGKTLRKGKGGASVDELGPQVPPKSNPAPATTGLPGSTFAQTGGFKSAMRDDSFGSSDFEARSVHDPEDGIAANSAQRLAKRSSILRHKPGASRDDAWIDIMMRDKSRMQNQDAATPVGNGNGNVNGNGVLANGDGGVAVPRATTNDPATHAVGSSMLNLPEADSDEDIGTPTGTKISDAATESPLRLQKSNVSLASSARRISPARSRERSAGSNTGAPRSETSTGHELRGQKSVPKLVASANEEAPAENVTPPLSQQSTTGLLTTPKKSSTRAERSPSPVTAEAQRPGLTASSSFGAETSGSLSASSSTRQDDLDAFPRPPSAVPPRTPTEEEISFEGAQKMPLRSLLRPMGDKNPQSSSDSARDARVSAAVLRARELRAKLNPVEARTSGDDSATASHSPAPPSDAAIKDEERLPASKIPVRKASDPFAKNPTSGKVASIAARFGLPDPVAVSPSPKGKATSPLSPARPAASSATSTSPRSPLVDKSQKSVPPPLTLPEQAHQPGQEVKQALTRAALATVSSGYVDPDMPPSPRQTDSVLGDNDSLAPDDAASNYSRTTEDSSDPTTGGLGGRSHWDGKSQAQHDSQQAFQNALLSREESEQEQEEVLREEAHDELEALPERFAEPYQPGQPLDNVFEESESMLSGSNC